MTERNIVREVEALLPPGAMVFQLPHTDFPVDPGLHQMLAYDHGRAFLHSRALRWSWGAWSGRNGNWDRATAQLPPEELVRRLAIMGFSGVWIDRFGYADRGRDIEGQLQRICGTPLASSADGRYALASIKRINQELLATASESVETLRKRILAPIELRFERGFYDEEQQAGQRWRWSRRSGRLTIENPIALERRVRLRARVGSGWPEGQMLDIGSDAFHESVLVTSSPVPYERELVLGAKQKLAIDFTFRGRQVHAPTDLREMYFAVFDLSLAETVPGMPEVLEVR